MRLLILLLLSAFIQVNSHAWAQREMWMSSTDENIRKRARTQSAPLFKVRVGAKHVSEMNLIGGDKLLVGLINDDKKFQLKDFKLISAKNGEIIWNYQVGRAKHDLIWSDEQQLAFRVSGKKSHVLKLVNLKNGVDAWSEKISSESIVMFIPETEEVWICDGKEIKGLSMSSGNEIWKAELPSVTGQSFFWYYYEDKVYLFSESLMVFSTENQGRLLWIYDDEMISSSPFIPTFDQSYLYLTTQVGNLLRLDKNTGQVLKRKETSYSITNISLQKDRVYLRGYDDSGFNYFLLAYDSANLNQLWSMITSEPAVSNLIHDENILYFASGSQLYAVNADNGNLIFNKNVTTSGRNFPVAVRKADDKICYIGELVVAGYDAKTGSQVYKHGFSPLDLGLHLNGLDESLSSLRTKLDHLQGYETSGAANMVSREADYYQKLSDQKYRELLFEDDALKVSLINSEKRLANSMSRMMSGLSLSFAIAELGMAIENAMRVSETEYEIRKQEHFRKTIIEVCNRSLSDNYVFRPNEVWHSSDDNYARLSIIELNTGKIKHHYLSPSYLSYGYYNLVDYKNGVIYHHGVGMQPEDYQLSQPRRYPIIKWQTVETFIIAVPCR